MRHHSGLPGGFDATLGCPIHSLSPEILTEAFFTCWAFDYTISSVLASVCARWRSIAFQATRLWSVVVLSDIERQFTCKDIEKASLWIKRSNTRPIHLQLTSSWRPLGESLPPTFLVDLIVKYASRLETLTIQTESAELFSTLIGLHSVELPILKSLILNCSADWGTFIPTTFPHAQFAVLPSLAHLTMSQSVWEFDNVADLVALFPWNQLVSWSSRPTGWETSRWGLSAFSNSGFYSALNRACNCVELILCGVLIRPIDFQESSARAPYNDLRVLKLDMGSQSSSLILDQLYAPHLEVLEIIGSEPGEMSNLDRSLLSFSASSRFPLTCLLLQGNVLDPQIMIEFLKEVPSLKEVKLVECELSWNPSFIESLIFRPEDPILPLIESLCIDDALAALSFGPREPRATNANVLAFLESRRQGNLQSVTLTDGSARKIGDDNERRRLEDLLALDWSIKISFCNFSRIEVCTNNV